MIFWGGRAKMRNTESPPAMRILIVVENIEEKRTPIMKMRRNITNELLSIIPGEPAVHLNALIHTTIQRMRSMSPGNTRDCCNPKSEKFQVYTSRLILKIERFVRLITEKAIIVAASV